MKSINKLENEIRRLKRRCKKLEFLVNHDPLTGAYNRRSMVTYIKGLINNKNSKEFHLVFLDINKFKKYNDKYGHLEGDKLLIKITDYISNQLPKETRFFRFAGDEFVICSKFDIGKTKSITKLIIKDMVNKLNISISVGMSSYPKNAKTIDTLLDLADKSMYKAKNIIHMK